MIAKMPWINPSNFKFIGLIYDAMNKSIFLVWYFMWKNTELEKNFFGQVSQFDWHKFPKEEKFVIFEGQFLVLWKNIENISDSVLHRLGRTCEYSQIKCWSLLIKLLTIWLISKVRIRRELTGGLWADEGGTFSWD